tara:strand:+ start:646 stop:1395 length:750 start_codon:yes stop_codon:yes gene_type:complete
MLPQERKKGKAGRSFLDEGKFQGNPPSTEEKEYQNVVTGERTVYFSGRGGRISLNEYNEKIKERLAISGFGFLDNINPSNKGRDAEMSDTIGLDVNGQFEFLPLDLYRNRNDKAEMSGRFLKVMESYPDFCTIDYNHPPADPMTATTDNTTASGTISFSNLPTYMNRAVANKGTTTVRRDYTHYPIFRKITIKNYGDWDIWICFDRAMSLTERGYLLKAGEERTFKVQFTDLYVFSASTYAKMNAIIFF